MPELDGFEWLSAAFQEAGVCESTAAGPVPLSWREIHAWHQVIGQVYSAWALGIVREMSEAYVKWLNRGGQQKDIADDVPYIVRDEESMQAAAQAIMRNRERSAELREAL